MNSKEYPDEDNQIVCEIVHGMLDRNPTLAVGKDLSLKEFGLAVLIQWKTKTAHRTPKERKADALDIADVLNQRDRLRVALDDATTQLTALRNAADGMAGKMLGAIVILKAIGEKTNNAAAKLAVTELRSELNNFRALIAEGNQPSSPSNSPTASRDIQG